MSFLDVLLTAGGNVNEAALLALATEIQAQQTALATLQTQVAELAEGSPEQQAAIDALETSTGTLQSQVTALSTTNTTQDAAIAAAAALNATQDSSLAARLAADTAHDAALAARAAADTAHDSAIAAAAAVNSTQQAALDAATNKLQDLFAEAQGVRIERFAPSRILTTGNFDQALRDAIAWCYTQAVPNARHAWNVVIPAGVWPVAASTIDFAGTFDIVGLPPTPGIIGPGSEACVLYVADGMPTATTPLIRLGNTHQYTLRQVFKGFSIIADGGRRGIGILAVATIGLTITDVRIYNFGEWQHYEGGMGLKFIPDPAHPGDQHQHVELRKVEIQGCQVALYLDNIAQLYTEGLRLSQNAAHSIVVGRIMGWDNRSGTLQGGSNLDPAARGNHWINGSQRDECTTGWAYRTGLPSGTHAGLATATYATDPDTNNANHGTTVVTGLTGLTADHLGAWLELLRASAPFTPWDDIVSGIYRITKILSATSCEIAKGTSHAAQTAGSSGVSWQVCGIMGGNQVSFGGWAYHEGYRRAVWSIGRDFTSGSQYHFDGIMSYNSMPLHAVGAYDLVVGQCGPSAGKMLRLIDCNRVYAPAVQRDHIACDEATRVELVCRGETNRGLYIGGRTRRRRLGGMLTDDFKALVYVDARRLDRMTIGSGTDIQSYSDLGSAGISHTPGYAGRYPQYVALDAALGAPAIRNVGNATANLTQFLRGQIGTGALPTEDFRGTIFMIGRKDAAGAAASGTRREFTVYQPGSQKRQISIGWFSYAATSVAGSTFADGYGNFGSITTGYLDDDDQLPRALVYGAAPRVGSSPSVAKNRDVIYDSRGGIAQMGNATELTKFSPGLVIDVYLGNLIDASPMLDMYYSVFAFLPMQLSRDEVAALLDQAAVEFPLAVSR